MVAYVDQLFILFPIIAGFSLAMPLAEMLGISPRGSKIMAILALTIALLVVLTQPPSGVSQIVSGFIVNMDGISYPISIAILLGGIVGVLALPLGSTDSVYAYLSMALMGSLASIMLSMARDPVAIISAWTLLSITTFATIALARDRDSMEASVRYSIVGSLASQLLILGVALVTPYLYLGSVSGSIASGLIASAGVAAVAFLSIAIAFKLGAAPSHAWVPDVYGSASPYVISLISGSLKLGVIGVLAWLLRGLYPISSNAFPVLAFISLASMLIGSITPLTQTNAQRILAYSSIAHMGFIFIGLSVISISHDNPQAFRLALLGVAFHTIAYSLGKSGVFAALNYMKRSRGRLGLEAIEGVARDNPRLSFSLAAHMLNLIGVPPLPGFWGKLFLFMAASQSLPGLYIGSIPWLALTGIIASVISVYYYLNILRPTIMIARETQAPSRLEEDPDLWASYIAAVATIVMGIFIYIFSYYIY